MGEPGRQRGRSATAIAVAAGLMTASVALLMTVPVRSPARGDEARTSLEPSESTLVDERWNELYREILANPQSMIGGFRASDAALDDFIGRARPAPPDVGERGSPEGH
jgi:hypothetical protein